VKTQNEIEKVTIAKENRLPGENLPSREYFIGIAYGTNGGYL
jgi:hypothetical protein